MVIVLKMFVIPINVITEINPYKNIEITKDIALCSFTSSSMFDTIMSFSLMFLLL